MKAIYNNSQNSLIAFKGEYEPIQFYKGGQLIDNISAVPLYIEGNPLNFKTEYNKSLIKLDLKGDTKQKSYEGYNLFDADTNFTDKKSGVTVTVKDGIIEMSGTSTLSTVSAPVLLPNVIDFESGVTYTGKLTLLEGTIGFRLGIYIYSIEPSGYKGSFGVLSTGQNVAVGKYTVTQDVLNAGVGLRVAFGTGDYNLKFKFELVKGNYTEDTFPPYEPYVGGKPSPNVEYPQPINSSSNMELVLSGANLFDISKITGWKQVSTGQVIYTAFEKDGERIRLGFGAHGAARALFNSEMVYEESEYTISFDVTNLEASQIAMFVRLVDMEKKKGVVTYYSGNDESRILPNETRHFKKTMSVPAGTYSLQIQGNGNASSYQNMSLWAENIYVGKANVDYEPYIEPTTVNIPIELNKLGDVADELVVDYSARKVTLIKRIEKFYLKDQIESVVIDTSWEPGNVALVTTTDAWENDESNLCSHCKRFNGDTSILSFDCQNNDIQFYIIEQSIEQPTPEDFIKWATDNNVQMALVRYSPEVIDYSSEDWAQELLNLSPKRNQTNVITITSDLPISEQTIKYAKWGGNIEN